LNLPVEPPSPQSTPTVRGHCYAFFAYDVGLGIDLDEAQRHLASTDRREVIRHRRRAPEYFGYQVPPLLVTQGGEPIAIGAPGESPFHTSEQVGCVAFDFGAVSVMYRIPFVCPLDSLLALSDALYENPSLLADSRRRVLGLLDSIRPAVTKPLVSNFVEDYVVIHIEEIAPSAAPAARQAPDAAPSGASAEQILLPHRSILARILRSERGELSASEIDDAVSSRVAFAPGDLAVIDWNATVLVGPDLDDVRAVLEYANVELLEMRFLDDRLDRSLETAYALLSRRGWRRLVPGLGTLDLRSIAELQVDGARLFEGVNNALKLLGEQYLARVYRMASQRLHLPEWDVSILRKLDTLESIHQKMSDYQTSRRLEVLEWVVIILIAVEVVMSFVRGH
jgi:hypothetical protein